MILLRDSEGAYNAMSHLSEDAYAHRMHPRDEFAHLIMLLEEGVSVDKRHTFGHLGILGFKQVARCEPKKNTIT